MTPRDLPKLDWQRWMGVPGWFSWENSGGGIAVARLGGARQLLAFMIDDPPGVNAGLYEVLPLDPDPARDGAWELLPFLSGVLAVHTALLPNGKVLFFAGSGSSAVRFDSPLFGDEAEGIFTSVVWDPPGNQFTHPATLRTANGTPFDFFCGGDAFLPDGRMLSAGGTLDYNPFKGRNDAAIFDFTTETWSFAAPMAHGRWYPTLTALADGRILATTGLNENGDGHNQQLEFYSADTDAWTAKEFVGGFAGLPLYAHLFLLADGRIFFSGGRMDDPLDVQPCIFDPSQTPVPTNAVPDLLEPDFRNQSASVLLPPAQDQRVMVIGGGPVGKQDQTDATGAVSIADLTEADPHYLAATPDGPATAPPQRRAAARPYGLRERRLPEAGGPTPRPAGRRDLRPRHRRLDPRPPPRPCPGCTTPPPCCCPTAASSPPAETPRADPRSPGYPPTRRRR